VNALKALERRVVGIEKAILIVFIVLMVFLSFLQVVLRGVFSSGLLWADSFLKHLVLWVGFLGASVAAHENKQFAMDAATRLFEGKIASVVNLVVSVFTAGVSIVLTSASWTFLEMEREAASILFSVGSWHAPAWIFQVILPGGFALLAFHYAVKSLQAAAELLGLAPPEDEADPVDGKS
jgi:TRAP-type C4-dicarboxylate transport system permease small subunit